MDVIIDANCQSVPADARPLKSRGMAALNLLMSLHHDAFNPPLADLLSSVHHLDGDWLIVNPVHWQASHNDALIVAAGNELNNSESEAKYWFEALAAFLAAEGMKLYYHDKNTWLLSHPGKPINAKPAYQIVHRSLMPELAQLDDSMYWQKFFTECQMFFASRPNTSLINGIWVWGGAKLKERQTVSICADEHFLSLAQACSGNVSSYNPSIVLKKFQIILLKDIHSLSPEHQEEIINISAQWYWNNLAYDRSSTNWFTRIWRHLIHAY